MSNQSIFTFNGHPLKAHYIDNQIWFESKAKQFDKYRKNGLYSLSVVHTHINKRTPHPIAFAVFLYLRFMSGGVRLYAQAKTVDCLVAGVKHPTPYSH